MGACPAARAGEYSWGGAADTTFWIAPRSELVVIVLQQLQPATSELQLALRPVIYAAIVWAMIPMCPTRRGSPASFSLWWGLCSRSRCSDWLGQRSCGCARKRGGRPTNVSLDLRGR